MMTTAYVLCVLGWVVLLIAYFFSYQKQRSISIPLFITCNALFVMSFLFAAAAIYRHSMK